MLIDGLTTFTVGSLCSLWSGYQNHITVYHVSEQKIPKSNLIILIDAINESELHRSDYGYSILSFLKEHLPTFPDFIKIVVTCRTGDKNLVQDFPGQFLSLDCDNPKVARDMQLYIGHRITKSNVLSNLTLSGEIIKMFEVQQTTGLIESLCELSS